jgi:hypothetical protein
MLGANGQEKCIRKGLFLAIDGETVASRKGSLEKKFNYSCSTKSSLSFSITTNFRGDTTSLGAPVSDANLIITSLVNDTSPRRLLSSIYRFIKSCKPINLKSSPTTLTYTPYEGHHH